MVISEPSEGAHVWICHFTLWDINARGYVRPVCMSFVTRDPFKIMNHFGSLQAEFGKVGREWVGEWMGGWVGALLPLPSCCRPCVIGSAAGVVQTASGGEDERLGEQFFGLFWLVDVVFADDAMRWPP